jgi:hypothetical protein
MMEKRLNHHQIEVWEEKNYFRRLMRNNFVALIATLLPAFTMGWGLAKLGSKRLVIRQLANVGVVTALNHIKKRMI